MIKALPLGAIAALSAVGTLSFLLWNQNQELRKVRKEVTQLESSLVGCNERVQNIIADIESDRIIDEIPDSDLPDVVNPCWLQPKPDSCP